MRWLALPLVLVACGSSSDADLDGPTPVVDPYAEGGTHDLGRCDAPDTNPSEYRCSASAPALSFAVCGDLQADNTLDVDGTLAVTGNVSIASPMHVGGNLLVGGTTDARNTLDVAGTTGVATLRCAEATDLRTKIDAEWLDSFPDDGHSGRQAHVTQPTNIALGCGVYRLEALEVDNTLDVHVEGHVVWLVRGDVRVAAPMHVTLDADASLEWVIGGRLQGDNTLDVAAPGQESRVWLGVQSEVRVASPMHLYGTLFAPRASLAGDNTLDVWGSAFVGPTRVASPMKIHAGPLVDEAGCTL